MQTHEGIIRHYDSKHMIKSSTKKYTTITNLNGVFGLQYSHCLKSSVKDKIYSISIWEYRFKLW